MMLRSTALGCVAFLALAGPALAGDGFYVGLGAGWDNQNNINLDQDLLTPQTGGMGRTANVSTNDGAIVAGTLGYKLPMMPIRLEFESGYDWHSNNEVQSNGVTAGVSGHANVASELVNALYDFPVAPGWNLYGGAGVGAGHVYFAPYLTNSGDQLAHVDHWGFMWQAIGGASFEIAPDADLFVDYRYRDAEARATTYTPVFGPVDSHAITENVVMAGVRFYMFPAGPAMAEEAPPPPSPGYYQAAPPPPPPPPPENNMPMNNGSTSGGATSGGSGGPGSSS
ncbi:MAG TPA: outer membrane beta-barrel protein [Rhizomicrobium sp.]|jgi:opacity protein-like surface antigen|nr:outer membrane beta-barrel protein [Rhizomicrobium sp.]